MLLCYGFVYIFKGEKGLIGLPGAPGKIGAPGIMGLPGVVSLFLCYLFKDLTKLIGEIQLTTLNCGFCRMKRLRVLVLPQNATQLYHRSPSLVPRRPLLFR